MLHSQWNKFWVCQVGIQPQVLGLARAQVRHLSFPRNHCFHYVPFLAKDSGETWLYLASGVKHRTRAKSVLHTSLATRQVQDMHMTQPEPMRWDTLSGKAGTKTHAPFLLEGRWKEEPGNRWQPSCNYLRKSHLLLESTHRRRVKMGRETRSWWHHLSPSADQIYPWTGQLYDLINSSLTWSSLCWDQAHCLNCMKGHLSDTELGAPCGQEVTSDSLH